MTNKLHNLLYVAALSLGLTATAQTTSKLYISENFDYAVGSRLGGNSNWELLKPITSAGENSTSATIDDINLAYDGYFMNSGNGLHLFPKHETEGAYNSYISFNNTEKGVTYASFLINVDKPEAATTFENIFSFQPREDNSDGSVGYGRVFYAAQKSGKLLFAISQRSYSQDEMKFAFDEDEGMALYEFECGKTYLLVAKYNQVTGEASLFVNPTFSGTEPEATYTINKNVEKPTQVINGVLLRQTTKSSAHIDGLRVATSWETLVDSSAEIADDAMIISPIKSYLGMWTFGSSKPSEVVVNIKARDLKEDITLSYRADAYFKLNTYTIPKEDAMRKEGYDLILTFNPSDRYMEKDRLIMSSGDTRAIDTIYWSFGVGMKEYEIQDFSQLRVATTDSAANYLITDTLVLESFGTDVPIYNEDGSLLRNNHHPFLRDRKGTILECQDDEYIMDGVYPVGTKFVNVRFYTRAIPMETGEYMFIPYYKVSPGNTMKIYSGKDYSGDNMYVSPSIPNFSNLNVGENISLKVALPNKGCDYYDFLTSDMNPSFGVPASNKKAQLFENDVLVAESAITSDYTYPNIQNLSISFNYALKENSIYKVVIKSNTYSWFRDSGEGFSIMKSNTKTTFTYGTNNSLTGITDAKADINDNNEAVFNIKGQAVNSNNLPAGIYLKNGKKFIVK